MRLCYLGNYFLSSFKGMLNSSHSFLKYFSSVSVLVDVGDAPLNFQTGFQDPATPIMEGIMDLYHDIFFFLVLVIIFVFYMIYKILFFFKPRDRRIFSNPRLSYLHNVPYNVTHNTFLEIVWTVIPSLFLVIITIPSFALLYSIDEVVHPDFTVKVIGHQWYWVYEYPPLEVRTSGPVGYDNMRVESYMLKGKTLLDGYFRALDVDNALKLPTHTNIRLLVTARDVLHSFAVPSLGLKMDACPGRLNQTSAYILREGSFYGQCSELCGINHAFMPILVNAVSVDDYVLFLKPLTASVDMPEVEDLEEDDAASVCKSFMEVCSFAVGETKIRSVFRFIPGLITEDVVIAFNPYKLE